MISDTVLCALIYKDVQKIIDRYKKMCGYKICVIICSMQASLNPYWLDHIKLLREQARNKGGHIARSGVDANEKSNSYANDVYPKNQHMYLNPRDALLEIQCKPLMGFQFHIYYVCFDNIICAQSIVHPKRNW